MKRREAVLMIAAVFLLTGILTAWGQHRPAPGAPDANDRSNPLSMSNRLLKAEGELTKAKDGYERWLALTGLSLIEAEAGETDDARAHAEEVLQSSDGYREDWNYGNAIHKGHLTLGLLALRAGDVAAAKEHLLAAGATPGSPQLNSFGPNMVLAKALLEQGETDAVLQYFQLCAKFWKPSFARLDEWSTRVREGKLPDFQGNVYY